MVHAFFSIGGRPKSGSQLLGAAWGHGHATKCVQNHKPKTRIRCGSRDCRGPCCIFSRVQAFWPCLFFQAVACRYACKSIQFNTWQTSTIRCHKMVLPIFIPCICWVLLIEALLFENCRYLTLLTGTVDHTVTRLAQLFAHFTAPTQATMCNSSPYACIFWGNLKIGKDN